MVRRIVTVGMRATQTSNVCLHNTGEALRTTPKQREQLRHEHGTPLLCASDFASLQPGLHPTMHDVIHASAAAPPPLGTLELGGALP